MIMPFEQVFYQKRELEQITSYVPPLFLWYKWETAKKLQTLINTGLQHCLLASPGRLELPTFRLGVWHTTSYTVA
jgi:hypothetical protein